MALTTKTKIIIGIVILYVILRTGSSGVGFIFVAMIVLVVLGLKHPEFRTLFDTQTKNSFANIPPQKSGNYKPEDFKEKYFQRDEILKEEYEREQDFFKEDKEPEEKQEKYIKTVDPIITTLSIKQKIWWKDKFAQPYGEPTNNFSYLVLDEQGVKYKGKSYLWSKIKNMRFVFKKSNQLAMDLSKGKIEKFYPGGKRLLAIKTGNIHKWKTNYVRVVDVKGFMETLKTKSMLYKFKKS